MEMAMETGRMARFGGPLIHYYLVSPGMMLRAEMDDSRRRAYLPAVASTGKRTKLVQRWTRQPDGSLVSSWETTR
jgi:hypothetical protein